jgi:hypothetical protein
VFQNSALSRIFGPKRDEVTGGWRELHNVYNEIKLNKTGGACRAHGKDEKTHTCWSENLNKRDNLEGQSADKRII